MLDSPKHRILSQSCAFCPFFFFPVTDPLRFDKSILSLFPDTASEFFFFFSLFLCEEWKGDAHADTEATTEKLLFPLFFPPMKARCRTCLFLLPCILCFQRGGSWFWRWEDKRSIRLSSGPRGLTFFFSKQNRGTPHLPLPSSMAHGVGPPLFIQWPADFPSSSRVSSRALFDFRQLLQIYLFYFPFFSIGQPLLTPPFLSAQQPI